MAKGWLSYFISVIFSAVLFSLLFWLVSPQENKTLSYTSPLPQFLTLAKNNQVRILSLWTPHIQQVLASETTPPDLTARSVIMYDLTENKALFEKNPTTRMPMASLTKIMTAIIALENPKSDDKYTVHGDNLVGEDSMGLEAGEVLSLHELLYGLFLNSGNDAAEVIASNYPAGRTAFIQAMNEKAKALGLTDTNFTNPTGLEGDGPQYTTAYDLLVITKYALDNFPEIRTIGGTVEHVIPATSTHKEYDLENETNLLTTYPGVKGLKTGYTPEAGYCLITYLEYDNHRIIGVLLGSEDRREEMKQLLDYSLQELGITPPPHS